MAGRWRKGCNERHQKHPKLIEMRWLRDTVQLVRSVRKHSGEEQMGQPETEELRYDFAAIEFMDGEWDRFYKIWLDLAVRHTHERGSNRVELKDAEGTLEAAVKALLKDQGR